MDSTWGSREMSPELIIECAPVFLKAYYEIQRDLFQHRLDNFDRVNWAGLQELLAAQAPPAVPSMHQVLRWIEDTLTD